MREWEEDTEKVLEKVKCDANIQETLTSSPNFPQQLKERI